MEKLITDLSARVDQLEREAVRFYTGEVTGAGEVTVGSADRAFTSVASLVSLSGGERVLVAVAGNDIVVLGVLP